MSTVKKPNVIQILVDDMGFGDIGLYNYGLTETPHIDTFIREGVLLTNHYSGSALCAPARACLLTGRYPHRTGVIDTMAVGGLDRMSLREKTIAEYFSEEGYATGLVGKWHCGAGGEYNPYNRGFDDCWWFSGGAKSYFNWEAKRRDKLETSDGRYLTDAITDESIDFIQRNSDNPFFLHLAHWAPHAPLEAPEEDLEWVRKNSGNVNEKVQTIYAMVRSLDRNIGRLLSALTELGLRENTIILFASDNGPQFSGGSAEKRLNRFNSGFRGSKGHVYEGGIRVPGVISWPQGLEGGQSCHEVIHFADWLPTLMEFCGLTLPKDAQLDGKSAAHILRHGSDEKQPARFWQWSRVRPNPNFNCAVRYGDWKLVIPGCVIANIRNANDGKSAAKMNADIEKYSESFIPSEGMHVGVYRESTATKFEPQLFDIRQDPHETTDLAVKYPERVERMLNLINTWFQDVEKNLCAIDEAGKEKVLPVD